MSLTFDPVAHSYALDGRPVAGVTSIIRDLCGVSWQAYQWYLDRGTVVHSAAALLVSGKLDWKGWEKALRDALTEDQANDILGRVRGIEKFLRETRLIGVAVEDQMGSAKYGFAGTCDLLARRGHEDRPTVIVDWKGSCDGRVQYQLGAYSLLYTENYNRRLIERAVAVELDGSGNYRTLWGSRNTRLDKGMFDLKAAEADFLAGLAFHRGMTRRGIVSKHSQTQQPMKLEEIAA